VDFNPKWASGFSLAATYYNINFTDKIGKVSGVSSSLALSSPLYQGLTSFPPDSDLLNFISSEINPPDILDLDSRTRLSGDPAGLAAALSTVEATVDNRLTNLSADKTQGLDVHLAYEFSTKAYGDYDVFINANKIFGLDRQIVSNLPAIDVADTFANPIDFSLRGGLSWSAGSWQASGFVNYADSYVDTQIEPNGEISSWTTLDLNIAFTPNSDLVGGALEGSKFSVSVNNVFDQDPPSVVTEDIANNRGNPVTFDYANAHPLGRFVAIQLIKEW